MSVYHAHTLGWKRFPIEGQEIVVCNLRKQSQLASRAHGSLLRCLMIRQELCTEPQRDAHLLQLLPPALAGLGGQVGSVTSSMTQT